MAAQLAQHNTPGVAECLIGFAALAVACGFPAAGVHAPLNRETYLQEMSTYDAAFSDSHVVVEDQIAEGDKVVTRVTWRGIHSSNFQGLSPTGTQIVMAGTVVQRIKDGNFVEHWPLFDSMGMMQQLGLIPPPQSNK